MSDGNIKRPSKVFALFIKKYTAAALHDHQFYTYIKKLPDHSIIASDKAYINFEQFDAFTARNIYCVTCMKDNADFTTVKEFDLPNDAPHIFKNECIEVTHTSNKVEYHQKMRRVAVFSDKYSKAFVYITNNFELSTVEIAAIYANRWQIETFFKKLKQNFPLTYFFGDNRNAIEVQIWCIFNALLLDMTP